VSRPATTFLAWLVSVVLLSSFLAAWYQSFDWGPSTWGALAGIGIAGLAAGLSYFQLRRSLARAPLVFLRGFVTGLALRAGLLAASGLLVWAATDWSLRHFLVALGLSYPPLLVLEAWQVQRTPRRTGARR
jgi:hypothetical protein